MDVRNVGLSGLQVSVVGVGCNNFGSRIDERQTAEVVEAALAAGITHFDTAESYGDGESEVLLGKALGSRRDQAVIATKFAPRPAGGAIPAGRPAAAHPGGLRRKPQAAGHRSHRSLLSAPARPGGAGRGGARGSWSSSSRPARSLHVACSNFSAGADRRGGPVSAAARPPGLRRLADPLEPSVSGGRRGPHPRRPPPRHGDRPLFPARVGPAHRQVPAGRLPRRIAADQGSPFRERWPPRRTSPTSSG